MSGSWFDQGGAGSPVDVAELLDGMPMTAMREIVANGALVSVGLTSDGGAVGVTVTMNGVWRREYFRKQDELMAWLAGAVEATADEPRQPRPSAASDARSRRSGKR